MKKPAKLLIAISLLLGVSSGQVTTDTLAQSAEDKEKIAEAMSDYVGFADYTQGVILPAQIDDTIKSSALFIDSRRAEDFSAGTIEGAKHMDWREIISRRDELPKTQTVIVFCQTGVLSAQAVFGLRVLGHENVLVMQGGLDAFRADAK